MKNKLKKLLHFIYTASLALCCYLLIHLFKKKNSPRRMERRTPIYRCSVIIPTYNRASSLQRTLESFTQLSGNLVDVEFVIVNNNCTDNTDEVCAQYIAKLPHLTIVHEHIGGLLAARHAGWRASQSDILIFCDDDITADPQWLSSILFLMDKHPQIMLLGGNNRGAFDSPLPKWFNNFWTTTKEGIRINTTYSLIEDIPKTMQSPDYNFVFGCNYAVRRKVLEKAGGFGPDCMPSMLFQGNGECRVSAKAAEIGEVWLSPDVSVCHHMPASRLTFEYLQKRGIYWAVEGTYTVLRHGKYWGHLKQRSNSQHEEKQALASQQDISIKAYLLTVLHSSELREWIAKKSYIGHEEAPHLLVKKQANIQHRNNW